MLKPMDIHMESKADLHFHTWHSIDSLISPKSAVDMAVAKGIRVLGITDHDTIEGAKVAKTYAEKNNLPVEIIIGEEIYSNGGHIVGLFLKERVESFQSLEDTLKQLQAQGAMIIIPHVTFEEDPLGEYIYRYRVSYTDLINRPELLAMIDGVEVENFQLIEPDFPNKATFINENFLQKARIGSSDCHIKMNFGHSYTLFDGQTAEDFRRAVEKRETRAKSSKQGNHAIINQIMGLGPIIKLPFHLILQFSYRILIDVVHTVKNTSRKTFKTPKKERL